MLVLASRANLSFAMPAVSRAISAAAVLLFSGTVFILFDVSRIVNGGETHYVMATLGIYQSIYNLFISLLQLLLALSGEKRLTSDCISINQKGWTKITFFLFNTASVKPSFLFKNAGR